VIVNLQRLFSAIIGMALSGFSDSFLMRRDFEFWFFSINHLMVIAPECSGIRSLLGFVIIASFAVVFDRHSIATAILIITTGVAATLVLNFLRILVTMQLRFCGLEEYSVGSWHGLLGMLIFFIGCIALNWFSIFLKSLTGKVGGRTGEN
jgi:exosortase/archaeosortase family protein